MKSQQKRVFLLSFLALFALIFSYSITMAQTPTPTTSQVEIIGTVEAMGTNSITVNQRMIDITNAEIKLTLAVGTAVKVQGTVAANGSIHAREVAAADAVVGGILPGEVEITGLLSALNSTSAAIGDQIFDVSTAEIKAGVVVGQVVKVHATFSTSGIWVAREVELAVQTDNNGADDNGANDNADDNNHAINFNQGEIEFTGTLTAMSANSITVAGQVIDITKAEIKDTLLVGALVKVHVSVVNGQLVAREVELARQNNNRGQGNGADSATPQPDDNNNNQGNGNNNDDNNHPEDNHNGGDDQGGDNHGGNQGGQGDNGGHGGHGGDNGGSGHG